jgi:hypothetical protein
MFSARFAQYETADLFMSGVVTTSTSGIFPLRMQLMTSCLLLTFSSIFGKTCVQSGKSAGCYGLRGLRYYPCPLSARRRSSTLTRTLMKQVICEHQVSTISKDIKSASKGSRCGHPLQFLKSGNLLSMKTGPPGRPANVLCGCLCRDIGTKTSFLSAMCNLAIGGGYN